MFSLYCCKDKCREYEFATCEYIGASCVRSDSGTQSNGPHRTSLEFRPEKRVGLLRCRIRRWVKRAFQCFELGRENYKFQREFNVELHGTDDDRELMARYNARREASGLTEFDRNVERLREAVHEASVNNRS